MGDSLFKNPSQRLAFSDRFDDVFLSKDMPRTSMAEEKSGHE
jgi:hypothetical protein